jgi:hypothetical protein
MFSRSSGPPLLPDNGDMESMTMSLAQITVSDWPLLLGTALGWLLIIIFMVTMQRKHSRLRADFKLLSYEVTALQTAEETRLMREIHDPKNKGRARSVTGRNKVPSPSLSPQ